MPGYLHFSQRFCILAGMGKTNLLTFITGTYHNLCFYWNAGQVFYCVWKILPEPEGAEDRSVCRNDGVYRLLEKHQNRLCILPHIARKEQKIRVFINNFTGKGVHGESKRLGCSAGNPVAGWDYCTPETAVESRKLLYTGHHHAASYACWRRYCGHPIRARGGPAPALSTVKCVVHRRNNANGIFTWLKRFVTGKKPGNYSQAIALFGVWFYLYLFVNPHDRQKRSLTERNICQIHHTSTAISRMGHWYANARRSFFYWRQGICKGKPAKNVGKRPIVFSITNRYPLP